MIVKDCPWSSGAYDLRQFIISECTVSQAKHFDKWLANVVIQLHFKSYVDSLHTENDFIQSSCG